MRKYCSYNNYAQLTQHERILLDNFSSENKRNFKIFHVKRLKPITDSKEIKKDDWKRKNRIDKENRRLELKYGLRNKTLYAKLAEERRKEWYRLEI